MDGATAWQGLDASLPLQLQPGKNTIRLRSAQGCLRPFEVIPGSNDLRCISFAVEAVSIK
jgi:hypothetical protein